MAETPQPERTRSILAFGGRYVFSTRVLQWLALFLVVAGVRLSFVASFGSAMPLLDQWDDEGARIFKPYLDGTLGVQQLFAPHNEHRHVLGRLLALGLLIANGQWDARLQMSVNAVIAAAVALIVAALGERIAGARHRTAVVIAAGIWSCLPYAWENTTWAFQSSFYFLIGFSLLAIWGLLTHRSFAAAWIIGAIAALLATFSTGSGFLAAAAVLGVIVLRLITGRVGLRDAAPTMLFCAAVIGIGLALRVHVPDHDVLRASSVLQWANVFSRSVAWPYTQTAAAAALVNFPLAVLAVFYFRGDRALGRHEAARRVEALLAVSGWVALQSAAIALTRGAGIYSGWMSPRYMDVLALGTLANFLALFVVLSLPGIERRLRGAAAIAGTAWVALVIAGAAFATQRGFRDMKGRAEQVQRAEERVRAYLLEPALEQLTAESAHIAYPWADRFARLLDDPALRGVLPLVIRPPLKIEPVDNSSAFALQAAGHSGQRIWSSEMAGGEMRSDILRTAFPLIQIGIRGVLTADVSLKFRDESTGRERGARFRRSRDDWRVGYAKVPGAFRVIARDEDPNRALVFTEPRELGRLSYYAERLLGRSFHILVCGVALTIALAMHAAVRRLPH